jgi:pyruvate dehydrogenase E1 component
MRRPEGRRPSGLVGLARHHHVGAVFLGAAAAGPRRGEAACEPGVSRHPVSVRHQTREKLENFRGYKGAQSYPSRTKDADDVDFSTGSVGLGVAQTLFSSLVQDYVKAHGWMKDRPEGRMIALVGDAEMDEGNIFEALLEGWKHGLRNTWWVVDYNRQSLDAVVREGLWEKFESMFRNFGWDVVIVKYGTLMQAAFAEPGGEALRRWIDNCPNQMYAALCFQGGAAFRKHLQDDIGDQGRSRN